MHWTANALSTIAMEWRGNVTLSYRWRPVPNQAGVLQNTPEGESGGVFVSCDFLGGRRAYLKPLKLDHSPNHSRAAREKIASDLAHDLRVPVPPVLLLTRDDAQSGQERHVCVSLVMYPRQFPWGEVRPALEANADHVEIIKKFLPSDAARGLAFDTWLGQPDHSNDHKHNIVFGFLTEEPIRVASLVYLDYAFSLGWGGSWDSDNYGGCQIAPFPEYLLRTLDKTALNETVSLIEAFDSNTISEVVQRIPETHLSKHEAEQIVERLCERRAFVRSALGPYVEGEWE